jgi:hypothetical protein
MMVTFISIVGRIVAIARAKSRASAIGLSSIGQRPAPHGILEAKSVTLQRRG